MRYASVRYVLALLIVLVFSATTMAAIPIEVSVGKGAVVSLKKRSARVSLSDPSIADMILISPDEILLNGKSVGTTSLIVWDEDGKRTFFDVYVVGDIGELIEQISALAPNADITVEMVRDSVLLKGTLKNEETIKKIQALSETYATKVLNFLRVAEPQQVLLKVRVAQIDKTEIKKLGLSFLVKGSDAEGFSGQFAVPDGIISGDAAGIEGYDLADIFPEIGVAHFSSGVGAVLRALAEKGLAKILAEPNLIVMSGEEGSFLVGSRVPVQQVTGVSGERTISIVYEEVGIKVTFVPEVLDSGGIRLKIDPAEVSNIARFVDFAGIPVPEIDTRLIRTVVELKEGESLVLAGLLSEETKKNIKKIPILGDIPILGALFRSTEDELVQTELAFFITPVLVKPLPPGEKPMLPGEEPLTEEEEKEFNWIPGF